MEAIISSYAPLFCRRIADELMSYHLDLNLHELAEKSYIVQIHAYIEQVRPIPMDGEVSTSRPSWPTS